MKFSVIVGKKDALKRKRQASFIYRRFLEKIAEGNSSIH